MTPSFSRAFNALADDWICIEPTKSSGVKIACEEFLYSEAIDTSIPIESNSPFWNANQAVFHSLIVLQTILDVWYFLSFSFNPYPYQLVFLSRMYSLPDWNIDNLYGPQEAVDATDELYVEVHNVEPWTGATLLASNRSFLTSGKLDILYAAL